MLFLQNICFSSRRLTVKCSLCGSQCWFGSPDPENYCQNTKIITGHGFILDFIPWQLIYFLFSSVYFYDLKFLRLYYSGALVIFPNFMIDIHQEIAHLWPVRLIFLSKFYTTYFANCLKLSLRSNQIIIWNTSRYCMLYSFHSEE